MIKVLFICHGNICRSPMAEFVMKDMVNKLNMKDEFVIESRATGNEEIINGSGNPVYPPVAKILRENGIDPSNKRAQKLSQNDGDEFDILICMDKNNIRMTEKIIDIKNHKKIQLLLDFDGNRDVADPWYTRDFMRTWEDVNEGCKVLLASLAGI